jgi:MerR family copper efflux transcriptional regulator
VCCGNLSVGYWERVGPLPKAARTQIGHRIFVADANRYIEFIRKAKSVGLTLSEMKRVIEFARQGKSPCPDEDAICHRKTQ